MASSFREYSYTPSLIQLIPGVFVHITVLQFGYDLVLDRLPKSELRLIRNHNLLITMYRLHPKLPKLPQIQHPTNLQLREFRSLSFEYLFVQADDCSGSWHGHVLCSLERDGMDHLDEWADDGSSHGLGGGHETDGSGCATH